MFSFAMERRREPFKSNVKTNTKVSVSTLIFVFSFVCVCVLGTAQKQPHQQEVSPVARFSWPWRPALPPPWCWDESAQSAVLRLRAHDGSLVIHHHRTYQFLFQREISASSSLKGWKFTIWWLIRLKISNPTLSIPKIFGRRYIDISLVIQMNPRRYAMHFSMATRDQSVITMCQTDDVFRPNLFQWIILKLWNEKRGAGQVLSIDQSTSLKS